MIRRQISADLARMASPIVSMGNQTGEGWFLTGEMMELIHRWYTEYRVYAAIWLPAEPYRW